MENPIVGNKEELGLITKETDKYQIVEVVMGTLTAKSVDSRLSVIIETAIKRGKHLFITGRTAVPPAVKIGIKSVAKVPSVWIDWPSCGGFTCVESKSLAVDEGTVLKDEAAIHAFFYPPPVQTTDRALSDVPQAKLRLK